MYYTFPANTLIMIVASMVGLGISAWFSLAYGVKHVSGSLRNPQAWRWGAAMVLAAWLIARLAVSLNPPGGAGLNALILVAFIGAGMLAGLLPLLSGAFRQALRAIPETWLVGIHAFRIGEYIFLALLDMKLLPEQFALPAGYGDILAGALALGVVALLANRSPYARAAAIAWNLYGLLDLAVAITNGIRYLGPFTAQLAASGVPTGYLNIVFIIPSFGVPVFTLLHIYSLYQLFAQKTTAQQKSVERRGVTA